MLTYAAHAPHVPHLLRSNRRILLTRYAACARLSSTLSASLTARQLTYLASPHTAFQPHITHLPNSVCCVCSPVERYQPCACPLGASHAPLLILETSNGFRFAHQICRSLAAVASVCCSSLLQLLHQSYMRVNMRVTCRCSWRCLLLSAAWRR